MPQVLTIVEVGFPGINGDNFGSGVLVPAGTPKDIIALPATRNRQGAGPAGYCQGNG